MSRSTRERPCRLGFGPEGHEKFAVLHAGGAGGDARETSETAVDVPQGVTDREVTVEHLLHQHDTPARRVHLLTEHLVGRAGRQAEPAVDARLDGTRHRGAVRMRRVKRNVVFHGSLTARMDAEQRTMPSGHESQPSGTNEMIRSLLYVIVRSGVRRAPAGRIGRLANLHRIRFDPRRSGWCAPGRVRPALVHCAFRIVHVHVAIPRASLDKPCVGVHHPRSRSSKAFGVTAPMNGRSGLPSSTWPVSPRFRRTVARMSSESLQAISARLPPTV